MARLQIEIEAKNNNASKVIGDVNSELLKLQDSYDRVSGAARKNEQAILRYEAGLVDLQRQLQSGSISAGDFRAQTETIKGSLESARVRAQKYNSQLSSLTATMRQVSTATNDGGSGVRKLEGYHQDFQKGIRGSTQVALEFGRVIQDAPYGIQGVANNIQQLTTNLGYYVRNAREAAAASGQVLTTGQLVGGVFRSLLSPMSLITIGISAITVGWQLWSKRAAKAKKETDALEKSTKAYADTLSALDAVQLKGAQNAAKESAELQNLYSITQDATIAIEDRNRAVDEIQKKYPAYFGNLTNEQILAGQAQGAYNRLTDAILATAQARAAYDRIAANSTKQLENEFRIADLGGQLKQLDERIAREQKIFDINQESARGQKSNEMQVVKITQLYKERESLVGQINERLGQQNDFAIENVELADRAKSLYKDQVKEVENVATSTGKATKALTDYESKINDIVNKSSDSANQSGLTGVDLDVEKTRQEYRKLFDSINDLEKKAIEQAGNNTAKIESIQRQSSEARAKITLNYIREQEANSNKEIQIAEETQEAITTSTLEYVRRLNESRTQTLLRQLNKETDAKLKAAQEAGKSTLEIEKDYIKQVGALRIQDRQMQTELAFDGSQLSVGLEAINQEIREVRRQFEQGAIGVDVFRERITSLENAKQTFDLMRQGVDSLIDGFSTLSTDIIFNTGEAFNNLAETFQNIVKSVISGLVKIGARYLINQAIGTSSMAAQTAASTAAAATTATAWSTAASLVAAATFGASAVAGGTALAALIASTKALSLAGFRDGGYTGNGGVNQIAGVVHGQEYVLNAAATRRYGHLAERMNNGTFTGVTSGAVNAMETGDGMRISVDDIVIDGDKLVIVTDRARKRIGRYGT